jgi:hypothetical protein
LCLAVAAHYDYLLLKYTQKILFEVNIFDSTLAAYNNSCAKMSSEARDSEARDAYIRIMTETDVSITRVA